MKKALTTLALLVPVTAFAHGSAAAYLLVWWHLALILFGIGFAVFSSVPLKRKLYSFGGFILFAMIAWPALGSIRGHENSIAVAVGVIPLVGFALGFRSGRTK